MVVLTLVTEQWLVLSYYFKNIPLHYRCKISFFFKKHNKKQLVCLFHQLDALCPAVDELKKLVSSPPSGHIAILESAAQVHCSC